MAKVNAIHFPSAAETRNARRKVRVQDIAQRRGDAETKAYDFNQVKQLDLKQQKTVRVRRKKGKGAKRERKTDSF
jgi:hypothetical protein